MEVKTSEVVWRDANTSTGTANVIGTTRVLFADCEVLPVTKNIANGKRLTIMIKKGDKVTNVIGSSNVTALYKAGSLTINQMLDFPVIKADNGGLFVGLPATGWVAMSSIKVEVYRPSSVAQFEELA
jgi:hypothetical protein